MAHERLVHRVVFFSEALVDTRYGRVPLIRLESEIDGGDRTCPDRGDIRE